MKKIFSAGVLFLVFTALSFYATQRFLPGNSPIFVFEPRPNTLVSSPASVRGKARGFWFFEANFPIRVFDSNGELLGTGIATAQDDWMTEDFVPFLASVSFDAPSASTGVFVFQRDNPSGLPENDKSITIPVRFE